VSASEQENCLAATEMDVPMEYKLDEKNISSTITSDIHILPRSELAIVSAYQVSFSSDYRQQLLEFF
jgi:hypothetical protein